MENSLDKKKNKIFLSAYACEPHKGSESGIGWNLALSLSQYYDVWVITRRVRKEKIEEYLKANNIKNLKFVYFDLPTWVRKLFGVQFYYFLWQRLIVPKVEALHKSENFDIIQHVTFGRYWTASRISKISAPFVWGPIGGGESAPFRLWWSCGIKGFLLECLRYGVRFLGERTPTFKSCVKNCELALATTPETKARLKIANIKDVKSFGHVALTRQEVLSLSQLNKPPKKVFRFFSSGRLLHWKGFHFGLMAFAKANIDNSEYWIFGDGPQKKRLEKLAEKLKIKNKVKFWGNLNRSSVLKKMEQCHVLIHPSLHDSGGWACLEGMSAGRPMICLDLGGPATVLSDKTGIKINAISSEQIVKDISQSMLKLSSNDELLNKMSEESKVRAKEFFTWEYKAELLKDTFFPKLLKRTML